MSPLLIMAIGMAIVLGMIIALRINPFISLITAAIVVSLLAPGSIESRITRVADAFGSSATNIGIVIALAAVIGQCMMESGAADRIVRAFMAALGEKRAPMALMGSGFVLAVPVFFDTVFYLLVPLARSLYKRTKGNYLLYILAISAGGAITHTLVPPTPGPLVMADQLGIDIGTMILVGAIVAMPAALAGLLTARLMNARMPIPMRETTESQIAAPHELTDDQLPGLFASLLPVVLPVLLISANTIASTLADGEHAAQFTTASITDWNQLSADLNETTAGEYVLQRLDLPQAPDLSTREQQEEFVGRLNRLLTLRNFSNPEAFDSALPKDWQIARDLSDESISDDVRERLRNLTVYRSLAGKDRERMKTFEFERMHRLLLESAFPQSIARHQWETKWRKISNVTALLGNANLALLLAAAIAIAVLRINRHPTFDEIAKSVELSLLSGGAVILITAAGGAFGAMLQAAQIGPAIKDLFGGSSGSGVTFLLLAFGIAALLKVAQGSSTTAMIVTSGMMSSILGGVALPFNPVYLATAIGGGSLIGSWMNDSGFWIVAKMSGLTETEALKTWTPLLIVLGTVSLLTTLLLAKFVPLTGGF
ncbi:MAG: GntP family permease [Planctomycetaceae bacterium]